MIGMKATPKLVFAGNLCERRMFTLESYAFADRQLHYLQGEHLARSLFDCGK